MNKISPAFLVLLFLISNNYIIEHCLGQECEDYSPCSCSTGLVINCTNVDPERIKQVFVRTTNYFLAEVNINFPPSALITLPSDLLGGKALKTLRISCSSSKLVIDPLAIESSRFYSDNIYVSYCDVTYLDFAFLRGFENLRLIEFRNCTGIGAIETLPSLPAMRTLSFISSTGFSALTRFPSGESFNGLTSLLFFNCEDLDARALNVVMESIAISPSRRTLEYLVINNNPQLSKVPNLSPFSRLSSINLASNNITVLETGSITISSPYVQTFTIGPNPIQDLVEPGAIIGDLSHSRFVMTYTKLTQMRADVFLALLKPPPLELNVGGSDFECDCSMAWLFRDNNFEFPILRTSKCFNGVYFDEIKHLAIHENC